MEAAQVGRLPGVLQAQLPAARIGPSPEGPLRRRGFWLLLALALLKGLLWSVSLPPWYGPDEPAHFEYVQYLATNHRVPATGDLPDWSVSFPYEIQCSTKNLGFRSNGPFQTEPPWGRDPGACRQRFDPAARIPASPVSQAGDYSPFYYLLGLPFWEAAASQPVETRLHAVRLLSVLLGVLATAFTYLAAVQIFGRRLWLAGAAAALFMLNPIESQQTAIVSNDSLLLALAAAVAWRLLAALRGPLRARDAIWLGLLIGAAFWAKPQGVFLAAGLPLVPLAARLRGEPWRKSLRPAALVAVVAGALVAAEVGGGLVWRGAVTPHGLLHTPPGPHGLTQWLLIYSDHVFNHLYFMFVISAWGDLSWFSASLPAPVLIAVLIAYGLAAAGLVVVAVRRRAELPWLGATVFTAGATASLILLLELVYYRRTGVQILQGRSFLEVWPLAAPALMGGLTALAPRRWEPAAAGGVALAALAVNCFALMVLWDTLFG